MKIFTKNEPLARDYWLAITQRRILHYQDRFKIYLERIEVVKADHQAKLDEYESFHWLIRLFMFKPELAYYHFEQLGISYSMHDDMYAKRACEENLEVLRKIEKSLADDNVDCVELSEHDLKLIGY